MVNKLIPPVRRGGEDPATWLKIYFRKVLRFYRRNYLLKIRRTAWNIIDLLCGLLDSRSNRPWWLRRNKPEKNSCSGQHMGEPSAQAGAQKLKVTCYHHFLPRQGRYLAFRLMLIQGQTLPAPFLMVKQCYPLPQTLLISEVICV